MLSLTVVLLPLATFFYGIFTILIIFSTYTVLTSGNFTRGNLLKTVVPLTMYTVSTTHVILLFVLYNEAPGALSLSSEIPIQSDQLRILRLQEAVLYLPVINFILSDAVVVWRVWLLFSRRHIVLYVPIICFLCTIVAAIVVAAFDIKDSSLSTTFADRIKSITSVRIENCTIYSLTAATNIWATTLVAVKAWRHRRHVKTSLANGTRTTRAEKLMALLVESGALYCLVWMTFIVTLTTSGPGFLVMIIITPQISGIYPTILIVLVNFGKGSFESSFIPSTPGIIFNRRIMNCQASVLQSASEDEQTGLEVDLRGSLATHDRDDENRDWERGHRVGAQPMSSSIEKMV